MNSKIESLRARWAGVIATALMSVACAAEPKPFHVSSQGPKKGWVKDAQTQEDFAYAATNAFDYVTFEIGARKHADGWLDEGLATIVRGGKRPWLVFKGSRTVADKDVQSVLRSLAKIGMKDEDVVVESDNVRFFERHFAEHAQMRRVMAFDIWYDHPTARVLRSPQRLHKDEIEPWTSIIADCRAVKAWGVRLTSFQNRVGRETIERFHAAGLKVVLDCVNDPVTGTYYRRAGVDGFVTANPVFTQGDGAWPTAEPKKTLLFGHRGGEDHLAPEHSAALTRLAVEHKMDIIKLDLQLTKDGAIVTSHDPSAKRVFGVNRKISDMTLAELKEMVALPVAGYTNEYIQTLEEVLAIAKDGIPQFGLDFKAFTPEMAEKALAIIAKAGVPEDRIFIITYTLKALAYMKERHPNVRRVMHTSVSYDARTGRWSVYQDVPGHVGVVVKRGTPVRTFATRREACQRILDFYKQEYGLYGVNIGVYAWPSDGPYCRFRLRQEDIETLHAGGLWVSVYMPVDNLTCDYYRRAGADAFITASMRSTYEPAVTK